MWSPQTGWDVSEDNRYTHGGREFFTVGDRVQVQFGGDRLILQVTRVRVIEDHGYPDYWEDLEVLFFEDLCFADSVFGVRQKRWRPPAFQTFSKPVVMSPALRTIVL